MTEQDKQLLLQDLCARLSYGVKVQVTKAFMKTETGILNSVSIDHIYNTYMQASIQKIRTDDFSKTVNIVTAIDEIRIKPYLRSISSMTVEERIECISIGTAEDTKIYRNYWDKRQEGVNTLPIPHFAMDWCNAHHFDYRGLIQKGLAIEVTKENNPYKD